MSSSRRSRSSRRGRCSTSPSSSSGPITGAASALDQLLEPLEVALDAAAVGAEHAPELLGQALRLLVLLNRAFRARVVQALEGDGTAVFLTVDRAPGHALVRPLLGDLGAPGVLLAADFHRPLEVGVVELADALDPLHEAGELLELRPLVVRRRERHVDFDRFLDARHGTPFFVDFVAAPLPASPAGKRPYWRRRATSRQPPGRSAAARQSLRSSPTMKGE